MNVIRLAALAGTLACSTNSFAQPVVSDFHAPNLGNDAYGTILFEVIVTYGKTNPGDADIDPSTIDSRDLRVNLSNAVNPGYQDWILVPASVSTTIAGDTVEAVYRFDMNFEPWGPQFNGTWTVELEDFEVANLGPGTFIPGQALGTFEVSIAEVAAITVEGRLWTESGQTGSLADDGHATDPGIEDWEIRVDQFVGNDTWLDYAYYGFTDGRGAYRITDMKPGMYRLIAPDILPDFAEQAVGDPTRGGVKDGYMYLTIDYTQGGQTVTVNFSYFDEDDPPNAFHDEYVVPFGVSDYALDVLANDEGSNLEITGLSDYPTTVDFGGRDSQTSRTSRIWTNGEVVYYTPSPTFYGWDLLWYRIEDGSGKTDLNRAFIYITPTPGYTILAVDDTAHVPVSSSGYRIPVLHNDILIAPVSRDSVTIESPATTVEGGTIEVRDQHLNYIPPTGFTGTDSVAYTVSGNGETGSATVRIQVTDTRENRDPREVALLDSLSWLARLTPLGAHYFNLIEIHKAEVFSLLKANTAASTGLRVRDAQSGPPTLESIRQTFFIPALEVLQGRGDSETFTMDMAKAAEEALDYLETAGSPRLRNAIKEERETFGSFNALTDKSLQEALAEKINLTGEKITVPVLEPELDGDSFSFKTFNVEGQAYTLWKTGSLAEVDWVPGAGPVTEDGGRLLRFTEALDGGNAFYRIHSSPEAGAGAVSSEEK